MKRKTARNIYLARFILFLCLTLVLVLIIAVCFCLNLTIRSGSAGGFDVPDDYSLSETLGKNDGITNLSPADAGQEEQPDPLYDFKYITDISEYEKYIEPENRDEYLILINKASPLDENYVPSDLIGVADTRSDRETVLLREYAEKALEALLIEARADGCKKITVTSAYRSYALQKALFNQRLAMYPSLTAEEAYAEASSVVAVPGTSEHQSGLSLDMHNLPAADISFADTPEGKWLAENSYRFGFILRYPADKTGITGISFEPWHFRFVGRYHAARIYESGYCLEEYMENR